MVLSRRNLLAGALALAAAPARAAQIDDCEKLTDADAYNKCLAGFGPARGGGRARAAPPPDADKPYSARQGRRGRVGRHAAPAPFAQTPGGRKRWIFAPRSR